MSGSCAICLGTSDEPARLSACGHPFCDICLGRYVASLPGSARGVRCPVCRAALPQATLDSAGVDASVADNDDVGAPEPDAARDGELERRFQALARRQHMRGCPHCGSRIAKDGGCDHMQCGACGERFAWSAARPVVRCDALHFAPEHFPNGTRLAARCLGTTCPGCGRAATAKKWAFRACAAPLLCATVLPAAAAAAAAAAASREAERAAARRRARFLRRMEILERKHAAGVWIAYGDLNRLERHLAREALAEERRLAEAEEARRRRAADGGWPAVDGERLERPAEAVGADGLDAVELIMAIEEARRRAADGRGGDAVGGASEREVSAIVRAVEAALRDDERS